MGHFGLTFRFCIRHIRSPWPAFTWLASSTTKTARTGSPSSGLILRKCKRFQNTFCSCTNCGRTSMKRKTCRVFYRKCQNQSSTLLQCSRLTEKSESIEFRTWTQQKVIVVSSKVFYSFCHFFQKKFYQKNNNKQPLKNPCPKKKKKKS